MEINQTPFKKQSAPEPVDVLFVQTGSVHHVVSDGLICDVISAPDTQRFIPGNVRTETPAHKRK